MAKKSNKWSWRRLWLPAVDPPSVGGIYFIQNANGYIKIGQSTDIRRRAVYYQCHSPLPVWIVGFIESDDLDGCEEVIFDHFEPYRVGGEWFAPCPELLDYLCDFIGGQGIEPYGSDDSVGLSEDQRTAKLKHDGSYDLLQRMRPNPEP